MKNIIYACVLSFITLSVFISCEDDGFELNPNFVELGSLISPTENEEVLIDTQNSGRTTFLWSPATTVDGGSVQYTILFDEEGGDFSNPIFSSISANGGGDTSYTIGAAQLNVIAARAGIDQLDTGNVIWTVQAASSYNVENFDSMSTVRLRRPEGLAIFPDYMYIYGSATESENLDNAVAFKEIGFQLSGEEIEPGVFESYTMMKAGEYYITSGKDRNDENFTQYYINEENKIRAGEQSTTFELDEGVYRIRMNLSAATISFVEVSDFELYIFANQITKAQLTYVGNHTFESTNGYFDFLTPGSPEAPSWLGWEEERYRFKYFLGEELTYLGSYHNDQMNASRISGLNAFNARPNGDQPDYYYNIYNLGPNAGYWDGAWKFPDSFNGASFTVRVVFDPLADHYYHELILN